MVFSVSFSSSGSCLPYIEVLYEADGASVPAKLGASSGRFLVMQTSTLS